jgi:signal-transduction protein with cAMP-binding, CBS, and nucleotidyltransferase domain
MRRRDIHSVVVDITEDNPHYGIVTSTDIRDKIIAADRNPADMRVRDYDRAFITADPEWTLKECSVKMQQTISTTRPLPMMRGNLIGIISATDIRGSRGDRLGEKGERSI